MNILCVSWRTCPDIVTFFSTQPTTVGPFLRRSFCGGGSLTEARPAIMSGFSANTAAGLFEFFTFRFSRSIFLAGSSVMTLFATQPAAELAISWSLIKFWAVMSSVALAATVFAVKVHSFHGNASPVSVFWIAKEGFHGFRSAFSCIDSPFSFLDCSDSLSMKLGIAMDDFHSVGK